MYNDLFTIGRFTIHGYGLMIAIGIIAAYAVAELRARKKGLEDKYIFPLLVWGVVIGFVCAKILYYITILDEIRSDPRIMLNIFDVDHPVINGLPEVAPEDTIHEVKRLTGRMVAINLEPAAVRNDGEKSVWSLTEGRRATVENAKKAADMGVDMIVLTGNPGVGVDNRAITKALADLNEAVGDRVILTAGKMHASGILSEAGEKILTKEDAETFIEAGADVLLLPAPGTVPGFTMEHAAELIKSAHEKGVLAMTTIGTSQEGADEATIRQIALMCKMAGADIHHIGDSGYMGMALPENITAYSVAIRGKRHTYRRMAMSLVR